jgi:hypothetical protein
VPFTEALDEIIERKYRAFLRNFNGYWVNGTIEWMSQRVLLWLFFKMFFTQKNILIIFFYFLKIIFEISTLKWFENIKNILLQSKKKIQIFSKTYFFRHHLIISWCWLMSQWVLLWLLFKVFFTQKKYINNIFLFFKNHFWDQYIKII